jgi:WD40 repeat protein
MSGYERGGYGNRFNRQGGGGFEDDGPGISGDKPDATMEVLPLPFVRDTALSPVQLETFKNLYASKPLEIVKSPFSALITAIGWNSTGSKLAVAGGGGSDHSIKLYDLSSTTSKLVMSFSPVSFSHFRCFGAQSRQFVSIPNAHQKEIKMKWSKRDPNLIVSAARDKKIHLWDIRDPKSKKASYRSAKNDIINLAWSPDDSQIAFGTRVSLCPL